MLSGRRAGRIMSPVLTHICWSAGHKSPIQLSQLQLVLILNQKNDLLAKWMKVCTHFVHLKGLRHQSLGYWFTSTDVINAFATYIISVYFLNLIETQKGAWRLLKKRKALVLKHVRTTDWPDRIYQRLLLPAVSTFLIARIVRPAAWSKSCSKMERSTLPPLLARHRNGLHYTLSRIKQRYLGALYAFAGWRRTDWPNA